MPAKPPYLPFSSFLTALDRLAQAVPPKIEKDVFPHHSGVLQGQLLGALRFLDLIDDNGIPKGNKLERLATEKDIPARRANLRPLLKTAYSDILKLDLTRMTPSQFDSAFERYGISGDTKKKAKAFFMKAAEFAQIEVSPYLIRRSRGSISARKRKGAQKGHPRVNSPAPVIYDTEKFESKTLELANGVTLTMVVKGNVLELQGKDRDLVFAIMDQLKSHV
jgi:hypothetical protein